MRRFISIALPAIFLSGCGTLGGGTSNITSMNFSDMSCSEIEQTFKSYKENMELASSGASLLSVVGLNNGATSTATQAANQAYETAKRTARPIMKMKNCSASI